ncbi:MAG: hypothetical protein M3Y71_06640 [Actinomycetota bacterium]|nr:hypothetical protein [Actinomycetota bacterium]
MAATDRTHHVGPHTDEASDAILDEALASLGPLRGLDWLGDAAITVHLLASLQRQIQTRLPDAVADARDQEYSWAEIGDLLGLTRAAAWHRYGRPGGKETPAPSTTDSEDVGEPRSGRPDPASD